MRFKSLLPIILATLSISAFALTSPNGKFKIVRHKDGVEVARCTPRGLSESLIYFHCGDSRKISESRRQKARYDMISGKRHHCKNDYKEGRYLLSDGDTLYLRLYKDGIAWKKSVDSEIKLTNPHYQWIPEAGLLQSDSPLNIHVSNDVNVKFVNDAICDDSWQTVAAGKARDLIESTLKSDICKAKTDCDDDRWISSLFSYSDSVKHLSNLYNIALPLIQRSDTKPEDCPNNSSIIKYMKEMPDGWDDTVMLGGIPGKYVGIARRSGNKWWISVINGTDEFLKGLRLDYSRIFKSIKRRHRVTLLEDAPEGNDGEFVVSRLSAMPYKIDLQPRGAMMAILEIQ